MGSLFSNWHSFRARLCKRGQLADVSSFPFCFVSPSSYRQLPFFFIMATTLHSSPSANISKKRNVEKAKSKEADEPFPSTAPPIPTTDGNTTATTTVTTTTATTNPQPPKDTPTSQNDEFEQESFRRYCGNPEGLWRRLEEAIPGYISKSLCLSLFAALDD